MPKIYLKNPNETPANYKYKIEKLLRKWGVENISWSEEFNIGVSVLRFRWQENSDSPLLISKFVISIPSEDDLTDQSKDNRTGKFSDKKYNRLKNELGNKEYRALFNLLKALFIAVEEKILSPSQIFFPWIEDFDGQTLYDKIQPSLHLTQKENVIKALKGVTDD
jgi:hypothetical protein